MHPDGFFSAMAHMLAERVAGLAPLQDGLLLLAGLAVVSAPS